MRQSAILRVRKNQFYIWMKHETNLPSLQDPPQAQVRIPNPHEDCNGPQTDQSAQTSRQRSPLRLTFGKKDRLLKRYEFKRLFRIKSRVVGACICIDQIRAGALRLGITAPVHYGSSPERNRFKRLVREAFRLNRDKLPQNIEINVSPRKFAKKASLAHIQEELLGLLGSESPPC